MSFKVGADPELFLRKYNERYKNWYYVSAETRRGPLIPGTKKRPFPVKNGAIQVDGVAAEFNIDPAETAKEFLENTHSVVRQLKDYVHKKEPEVHLVPTPTATFRQAYFDRLPEHVKELGCDPDFDAYKDGKPNPRPKTDKPFRTGSGHLHLGWYSPANFVDPHYEGHIKDGCMVTKQMDKYGLFASKDWDTDETRRELYGAPGAFRPKPFGVEYRSLSNAWLKSPETVQTVFLIALGILRGLDKGELHLGEDEKLVPVEGMTNSQVALRRLSRFLPEYFK